jgi:DeoR family fructose operon transcriptional repressor
VAFLGTNGYAVERGFTTPDQVESSAKRAMAGAARRVVVLSDASKAGQVHLHRFLGVDEAAMLVTDDALDDETAERLENAGTEVVRT